MTSDPALSGYGVVQAPGLFPADSMTVVANLGLTTAYPVNTTIADLATALGAAGLGTVTSVSVTTANGVSGSVATATTTPAITITLGAITPTSVAINGATIGTNALAVTGTAQISGQSFVPVGSASAPSVAFTGDTQTGFYSASAGIISASFNNSNRFRMLGTQLQVGNSMAIGWSSTVTVATMDLFLNRRGAANLLLGAADAAAPVAQTVSVQGVVAGTSNTVGATWTFAGSVGTGTGVGGDIVFTVAPAGSTGTAQNAAVDALTLKGTKSVVVGSAALGTTATDGFLYIPTCAGTPTGVPTAFTGRVALIYDTTNKQFWIYDGAWLQPKTPAAAAIVTWQ